MSLKLGGFHGILEFTGEEGFAFKLAMSGRTVFLRMLIPSVLVKKTFVVFPERWAFPLSVAFTSILFSS